MPPSTLMGERVEEDATQHHGIPSDLEIVLSESVESGLPELALVALPQPATSD